MKNINFKESNIKYELDDQNIPAYVERNKNERYILVCTKTKLTILERIKLLIRGVLWVERKTKDATKIEKISISVSKPNFEK